MKKLTEITLSKTSGTHTIAQATDVFYYIDSDFKKWGTDKKGKKTDEMKLEVCEMTENATFTQLFTKPDEMCLSQDQIIEFCKNHTKDLCQDWSTFFLFKVSSDFFVARVYVFSGGRLNVKVDRFDDDFVWSARYRRRFVLPQLALSDLDADPLTLSPSDPLKTIYTKYRDEKTGITAKISNTKVSIKNSNSEYGFDFRNSTKETVKKVAEALLRLIEK